jgi:hypothetical protein
MKTLTLEMSIAILEIYERYSIGKPVTPEQKESISEAIKIIIEHYKKVLDMTVTLN